MRIIILGLLTFSLLFIPVYGQSQVRWLTHRSNNCKLTLVYPSTWTIGERNGTAGAELKISYNNLKAGLPSLIFTACLNYNPEDIATLEIYSNTFLYAILSSDNPHYQVVNYSHLEKNFMDGKDADIFDVVTANNTTNLKMEVFTVINNTMLYQFTYSDLADHFDSPEGKQIRDHILKSIKFLP